MTKAELLDTAKTVVCQRGDNYGEVKEDFQRIATMWTLILKTPVSPRNVAACMIALKLSRLTNDPSHTDSIVDIAGYAACWAELLPENNG